MLFTCFVWSAGALISVIMAAVVVATFFLGLGMMCFGFTTDKIWYSVPCMIFGLCLVFLADWLAGAPLIPLAWQNFVKTHRD